MSSQRVHTRSQIDPRYTWNSESLFPSVAAWEAEFASVARIVPDIRQWQGHLGDGPAALADALAAREELRHRLDIVSVYANLEQAVDTTNQAANQRMSQAQGLEGQAQAAMAFFNPELLAIGKTVLEQWLQEEPRLAVYEHFFEDLFRRQPHVRSAEVEEVLGMAADPFAGSFNTFSLLTNADLQFRPATGSEGRELAVTQGTLLPLLHGSDREARRTAWESYADGYLAHKNTLASNLTTSIKQNVLKMRARRHSTTLAMALFEDNLPVEVFTNLIDTFRKNLPTWHRYWRVRRTALGVDTLHPYDVWAPLSDRPPQISYEQAVEWVCQGLAPLGAGYVGVMRRGCMEDRWVDAFPSEGKTAGAFSSGRPGTHPFIVMSFAENVPSLGTLAHELGHSMHSYLAWQTQPRIYGEYSLFVAEVASNLHQAMLRSHLLSQDLDRDLQIAVIEEAMTNFHRYFLVMPTLARFELEVHQRVERGEGLTADGMIELLADLFGEAYGGEMHLDRPRVGIQWSTFPHLFEDYYVYQYATGISGAHALATRILAGEPDAAENYLRFLSSGGALYPLDALRLAGVDLASPEPVEQTFRVLSELVDRLELLVCR